jgi:predicted nucleic acid-binding protein
MILIDTSVWVDHLQASDAKLTELLDSGAVLGHPFVTGELALGNLRQRDVVLGALRGLPQAIVAMDQEMDHLIDRKALFGLGSGTWTLVCWQPPG